MAICDSHLRDAENNVVVDFVEKLARVAIIGDTEQYPFMSFNMPIETIIGKLPGRSELNDFETACKRIAALEPMESHVAKVVIQDSTVNAAVHVLQGIHSMQVCTA